MARNNDRDRDRGSKRILKDNRPRGKQKICVFCKDSATWVDYKDVNLLKRFMSDRGRIRSRRVTGNCAQHQRDVQVAIKTAREVALLPYAQRMVNERGPGRGPRPPRSEGGDQQLLGGVALDESLEPEDEETEEADAEKVEKVGV
jgi:small subunit ribosomal protein S18